MIDHYQNEKGLTSIVFDVSFCFKGTLRNEAFSGELSKNYSLGLKPPQLYYSVRTLLLLQWLRGRETRNKRQEDKAKAAAKAVLKSS